MDIRQGTATTLWAGPVVSTSGITSSTAYTIVWYIAKNNGAFAATTGVNTGSTMLKGFYKCPLTATNVGTLGDLVVGTQSSAYYLYVWDRHQVVTANYFDTRYGTDEFQVDVVQVIGSTSGADDLEGLVDDIAGLHDLSTTDLITQTSIALNASTMLYQIVTDTSEIQGKLPTSNIAGSTELADINTAVGALHDISTTDVLTQTNSALSGLHDVSTTDILTQANSALSGLHDLSTTDILTQAHIAVDASTQIDDIATVIGALNNVSTTDILTQAQAGVDASTQIDDIATAIAAISISSTDILTQTNAALAALNIDNLINVDAAGAAPTSGSYLDLIMNKSTNQTFSQANDSLEALRDRGDAGWITGGGTGVNYSSTDVYDQALAALNASTMIFQIVTDTSEIQSKLPTSNIAGSTELADVDGAISGLNNAVDVSTDVNDILINIAALNNAADVSTDINDIYTVVTGLNDAVDVSTDVNDILTNIAALNDAVDVSTDVNDIYTVISGLNDVSTTDILTQAQGAVDASTEIDDIASVLGALNNVSTTDILTQGRAGVDASTQIDDIASVLGALNNISTTDILTQAQGAVDASTEIDDIATDIGALNNVSTTDIVTQANAALASAVTEPTALSMTKSIDNMMWGVYGRFYHKNLQGTSDQITYTSTGGEFATRDITSSTSDQMIDKAT